MKDGQFEGAGLGSSKIRDLFTRESMLASDWYAERLQSQQTHDIAMWKTNVQYLENYLQRQTHSGVAKRLDIESRLTESRKPWIPSVQKSPQSPRRYLGRQPIDEYVK